MKLHHFFLGLTLSSLAAGSAWFAAAQRSAPAQAAADNEYQLGAVLFQQKAAEYRALAYQAFNFARWQLDADLDKKNEKKLPKAERKKRRAIVVDIDETVLDNSPAQAKGIRDRKPFNLQDWYAWGEMRKAKAIPGSVDFLNYAASKGVRIFYVSNRDDVQLQATIDNLRNVGFRDVSNENVLLRVGGVSTKEPRRTNIAASHRVVLLIGDNLDDFSDVFERKAVTDRFAQVDRHRSEWGKRWIVLPNAMYGTWENAVYGYARLNEAEKARARHESLELP
jgi:5'-nucleotidase (lipoprotein e(P4) family)